jgi:hypothetical protein
VALVTFRRDPSNIGGVRDVAAELMSVDLRPAPGRPRAIEVVLAPGRIERLATLAWLSRWARLQRERERRAPWR